MFISFSNGNGSAFENSLPDSGYPFASVPARCTQTTLLETWQRRRAETVGLRHDWAIVQCHFRFVRRRWKARFNAHLNRLQGHRRQPIARSGNFVRHAFSRRVLDCAYAFSHRPRCTKITLLEMVVAEMGQRLSLYDHGTTERSFNAVERRGSTLNLNSLHGSRLRGTANLYDVLIRGEHLIVKSRRSCHHGAHVCLRGDWVIRGRGKIWRGSPQWNTKTTCQNHKQLRSRSGPSIKEDKPEQPGWKYSKYWANIEKKESN